MILSIVVPTYNRAHLIEITLKSVLNQTCNDFEVIIIDDGSTDNTEEIIRPYLSDKVFYHKISNSERGAARNRGTELAKGKYVNWFDSDDEMFPNHVETVQNTIVSNNYPEIVTVHYNIKDQITGEITTVPDNYSAHARKRKHFLIEGNYLACNPVIVRKDIALENPFIEDRNLSASEDYELWLRLLSQYPFVDSGIITSNLIQHDERSVNTMIDPKKLETRFLTFLDITTDNTKLKLYLGDDFTYFVMRNYLVLAVDLAFNKNKKIAFNYLKKAVSQNKLAFKQRVFWATIKHILLP